MEVADYRRSDRPRRGALDASRPRWRRYLLAGIAPRRRRPLRHRQAQLRRNGQRRHTSAILRSHDRARVRRRRFRRLPRHCLLLELQRSTALRAETRRCTTAHHPGESISLRRRRDRLSQKSLDLRPGRSHYCRARARQYDRERAARRRSRRWHRARLRERFLRFAPAQPRRHTLSVADVEPSEHALGRHGAVGRRDRSRRLAHERSKDRRRTRQSLSSSPNGPPTARSISSPTERAGGISTAGATAT
jgi:hypothetical protein